MESKFQYHPIVEGLKVNEDGSEIIYNGKVLKQYKIKGTNSSITRVKGMNVSVLKLVCECWNGIADSPEFIASLIDENKGSHFSNLEWRKRGEGVYKKKVKRHGTNLKFKTKEELELFIAEKPENMTFANYLKEKKVSEFAFYGAKKRYKV